MNIAILDDYQDAVRHLACFRKLDGHDVAIYNDTAKDEKALAARLTDADALVLIRERSVIAPTLLDRLPRLRLISQTGKIAGHINLADCSARGIAVAQGQGAPGSTAELTWALIMASMRHIPFEVERLKAGHWQSTIGRQLRGKQLGVWSYGKIGKLVAGFGKVFGMSVWVWGRDGSKAAADADGVEPAPSRETFFASSDVISLHIRLNTETSGIVTARDLAMMKSDALIVNTSRAELIESGALVSALQEGRPGFAAVDVYENEPVLGARDALLTLPNALCTPHLGYVERENYELYFGTAFDNIVAFTQGRPQNIANPEVLDDKG